MILALKKINIIEDTKKIIKLALKIYIYADKTYIESIDFTISG